MQDSSPDNLTFDETPSDNRAYWMQGLENGVWKNLQHFPTSAAAISDIGTFVSSKSYSELRLVSATFSPITESIKYKLLAIIANGSVVRPDKEETIASAFPQINEPNIFKTKQKSGDPYAPYAFSEDPVITSLNAEERPFSETSRNGFGKKLSWPKLSLILIAILFFFVGGFYLYGPDAFSKFIDRYTVKAHEFIKGEYLISAILDKNIELLTYELDRGISPDTNDYFGNSALSIATDTNYADAVKKLLKSGANPDRNTSDGTPVLLIYVTQNNLEMVQALVTHGADLNAAHTDRPCRTALSIATKNNFEAIKNLLIENDASENLGQDCNSELPAIQTPVVSDIKTPEIAPIAPVLANVPEPIAPPRVSEPILMKQPLPDFSIDDDMGRYIPKPVNREGLIISIRRAYGRDN